MTGGEPTQINVFFNQLSFLTKNIGFTGIMGREPTQKNVFFN